MNVEKAFNDILEENIDLATAVEDDTAMLLQGELKSLGRRLKEASQDELKDILKEINDIKESLISDDGFLVRANCWNIGHGDSEDDYDSYLESVRHRYAYRKEAILDGKLMRCKNLTYARDEASDEMTFRIIAVDFAGGENSDEYVIDVDKADIDFPNRIPRDRAEAWMNVYAPSVVEEIDQLKEEYLYDGDVGGFLMNLKNVDINKAFTYSNEYIAPWIVDKYLSDLVLPDSVMPFRVDFDGLATEELYGSKNQPSEVDRLDIPDAYAYLHELTYVPYFDEDNRVYHAIGARMIVADSPDPSKDESYVMLIDGFNSVQYLRFDTFNS